VIAHYLFQRAFITTIREKEALNTQLQFAVQEANRASESKSDFLSTMSHELRTPLNSVIGISELLLTESKNDEQIENLRILKFSAENLHSLINDILDYNKLDSEKLDLEAISVDLYELINNVSSGLRFQAKQKGIDFILEVDKVIAEHRIITDPTRIAQIIYNLAGNAIKFTENGSVTIRVEITSVDTDTLNLQFSVIDTGIGISADKQAAIFEPFTQASSSTTRKFGGTGLGLAIVKRLLSMFNSNIDLESIPERGSTFSFAITFKRDKEKVLTPDISSEIAYDLSDLKILVAEDNQMNRLLLTKVLARWNNSPVFALNGLEAVEKVKESNYDLVLMDLHMPLMNGYEATKAIRNIADPVKSAIRIIALTASVSSNLNNKINEVGMDGYIHKPFKLDDLYNKLKSIPVSI
ncbi:MAG: ATP-binding protein, partial [Sphingobacteriaceae bacterium]